jgi:hypothetical protein
MPPHASAWRRFSPLPSWERGRGEGAYLRCHAEARGQLCPPPAALRAATSPTRGEVKSGVAMRREIDSAHPALRAVISPAPAGIRMRRHDEGLPLSPLWASRDMPPHAAVWRAPARSARAGTRGRGEGQSHACPDQTPLPSWERGRGEGQSHVCPDQTPLPLWERGRSEGQSHVCPDRTPLPLWERGRGEGAYLRCHASVRGQLSPSPTALRAATSPTRGEGKACRPSARVMPKDAR